MNPQKFVLVRGKRIPLALALAAVWIIPAVFSIVESYTYNRIAGRPFTLSAIVLRASAMWVTYAIFTPVILWLATRFALDARARWRNLLIHCSAAVAIGAAAAASATLATSISRGAMASMQTMTVQAIFLDWFLGGLPLAFIAYSLVVGFAYTIRFSVEARQRREDALRLETQLVDARLAALQGRLHPHFLYNTLNSVTVMVRDGEIAQSTRMLELLGEMLRRILDKSLPQIISLKAELDLLSQYLEIEQVRFSDRLTVHFNVAEDVMNVGIPALITQPLAENAIRHAVALSSRPVSLRISAERNRIAGAETLVVSLEDDGPGLTPDWREQRAKRTGVSVTKSRLETIYGSSGRLDIESRDGGGTVSRIQIPAIQASDTSGSIGRPGLAGSGTRGGTCAR